MRDVRFARSSETPAVTITPPGIVRRRFAKWNWIDAESVEVLRQEPFEYGYQGGRHLLIAAERAHRRDGETQVEGLPKSNRREYSQKLTFVPAGSRFYGWQQPRLLARVTFFYVDPKGPLLDPGLRFSEVEFRPRLFFADADLWATALKLKGQLQETGGPQSSYLEALTIALAHELVRSNRTAEMPAVRGGLSPWQQRTLSEFIEAHLAGDIALTQLAGLVDLSPYHFARAFKQSFGMPPHRYLTSRRMEHAKLMLARPDVSVTAIGHALGFSETSAFTAAFRKFTGATPTDFRRALQ